MCITLLFQRKTTISLVDKSFSCVVYCSRLIKLNREGVEISIKQSPKVSYFMQFDCSISKRNCISMHENVHALKKKNNNPK